MRVVCAGVLGDTVHSMCECNIGYSTIYMTDLGGGEIRGNLLRSLYYIRWGGVTVHAKISCPIERHEPGYRYDMLYPNQDQNSAMGRSIVVLIC